LRLDRLTPNLEESWIDPMPLISIRWDDSSIGQCHRQLCCKGLVPLFIFCDYAKALHVFFYRRMTQNKPILQAH
jgi:hypothetical protein